MVLFAGKRGSSTLTWQLMNWLIFHFQLYFGRPPTLPFQIPRSILCLLHLSFFILITIAQKLTSFFTFRLNFHTLNPTTFSITLRNNILILSVIHSSILPPLRP
ncbi:hypothetical protein V8G54_028349 [Vigna mungo]|uniref:Uncharacterized protein n=1 Tax=Vigna mungo TaxID=3915 RepID=A0AAQ3RI29_VIGMU